ncbi:MAG: hypothetical protein ACT4OL_11525 [Nitrospiraceae bacterium]
MPTESGHPPGLPERAIEALWRGNMSEAIEQVRLERNLDLEEARDQVGTYILSQPTLQRKMIVSQSHERWGLMRWLILLQVIIGAIVYFLFLRD